MKLISQAGKYVVFPFLLPVFFVLHLARIYWPVVPLKSCVAVATIYLLVAAVLFLLLRKGSRHGAGAGLATLLLVALAMYWGEIITTAYRLLHLENFTYLPMVAGLWLCLAGLLSWRLNRQSERTRNRVTFYLNALFIVYIALDVAAIGITVARGEANTPLVALTNTALDRTVRSAKSPNVYFLLFDEYASSASLKYEWGFDNSPIDTALKGRGFFISANSRSNYQHTFYSMASTLNIDYLSPKYEEKTIQSVDDFRCYESIDDARIVSLFKKGGYQFLNLSIFTIDGQDSPPLRDLVVNGEDILTYNSLYNTARRTYIPYLQNRQAIKQNPEFHDLRLYDYDVYNNTRTEAVCNVAREMTGKPKLVYAHFLMPHPPFYYDSVDAYLPNATISSTILRHPTQLYWYSIQHANKKMLQMVDAILKNEGSNAIIWILGDHGFRSETSPRDSEQVFRNFNAVYFPERDYQAISDSMTNVNVFRIIANKLFHTGYPMLRDKTVKLKMPAL